MRWYLRYTLSYRDVEELMRERGIRVDHTTVFRWVQRYAPELDQRCRPYLRATNDSYRVDETYIKIKKRWYDLYRALDSTGATVDFMLSPTRDAEAAERFFRQVLQASHACTPRIITVDKHAAYPPAFEALQQGSNRGTHQGGYPHPEPAHQPAVRVGRIKGVRPAPPSTQFSFCDSTDRCTRLWSCLWAQGSAGRSAMV